MNKTLNKMFKLLIIASFACFLALFFSKNTTYREYENKKQVALTAKQIQKFEKDVKEGNKIDIKPYLENSHKNYQNNISKIGLEISKTAGSGVKTIVEKSFKFLSKLSE